MKTNETIITRSLLCGVVAFTLLASCAPAPVADTQGSSPITWTTQGQPSGKMDVLYVQNAKGVTLEKGKLGPHAVLT